MNKHHLILDSQLLTTLMACPRLADFRFNHHLVPITGKSNSLETGSIVHKVLEVFYGHVSKGMNRTDAINFGLTAGDLYIRGCPLCTDFSPTPEVMKPICGHKPNDFPGVKNTPPESSGYVIGYNHALRTCEEYFEFYKNDFWVPLETETVKGEVVYEDDEIRILWKAKLDLIVDTNNGIYPVDHKTMKQRRDTIGLNNQFIGQCIVSGTRNVIINKIGFQTSLKPQDKFTRAVISYSADRIIEWQSTILPYYAKLLLMYTESEYFPPNWTHCENKYGVCQFKSVCESDLGMRESELKQNFMVGEVWDPTND